MHKESLIKKVFTSTDTEALTSQNLTPSVREPLPTIQTYCQSKTFIAAFDVNPLTACAAALFSLLNKLRHIAEYTDIAQLKQDLIHEIKAFECAALNRRFSEQQIIIARYALCATLDDVIMHTSWGASSNWGEDTLLYIFQGEMWGGERLFAMLEHLRNNNEEHLELLEFIYLCMSLGFEGKYRINPKDKDSFYDVLDATYKQIKNARGDVPSYLSKVRMQQISNTKPQKKHRSIMKPILLTTTGIVIAVYCLFSYMTQESAKPILTHIQQIESSLS